MIGRQIDRYRLDAHLGKGGMASVWRATDLVFNRAVAVKILDDALAAVPEARKRFQREAEIASLLDHPVITPVYGNGVTENLTWIAMKLVVGETLAQVLQRRLFSETEAVKIVLDVTDALGYAHARGVVHRDVTSRNIMLESGGRVFLLDFGLARAQGLSRITSTSATLGTPGYTSPEVLRGFDSDPRSDVYSLGVVLFELLTGRLPFQGERPEALSYAAQHLRPEPPSRYRPGVSEAMDRVVLEALEREPADRHTDCEAFATAIRKAMGVVTEAPSSAGALRPAEMSKSPLYLAVVPVTWEGEDATCGPIAAALTRALDSRLASLGHLHVLHDEPLHGEGDRAFAWRIGANVLLKGRVRVSGTRVRAELGIYEPERSVWIANTVADGSAFDLFQLEDTAVRAVGRSLGIADFDHGSSAYPVHDPAAAEHFLQACRGLERHDDIVAVNGAIGVLESLSLTENPAPAWLAYLSRAYLAKHRLTKERSWESRAASACHRALEMAPDSRDGLTALADLQSVSGNLDEAERTYRRVLEEDPDQADAWRGLARLYDRQGRGPEAEDACRRAIALRPDDWRGYGTLGLMFFRRGDYVRAVEPWRRVMRLTPDNARGAYNLGSAYFHLDRVEEAIQAYRRSLEIRPSPRGFTNLGTALFTSGRFAEAAETFSRAIAMAPQDPEMWGNLGNAFRFIRGRESESIAALERAIALARDGLAHDPQNPEMWALLADWYETLGNHEGADAALAQALAGGTENVHCLIQAAHVHQSRKNDEQTLYWLEEALRRGYGSEAIRRAAHFAPLLANPQFVSLLERYSARREMPGEEARME